MLDLNDRVWMDTTPDDPAFEVLIEANGINDRGEVVGASGDFAFRWSRGRIEPLELVGESMALAINDAGAVAGWMDLRGLGHVPSLWWKDGARIDLAVPDRGVGEAYTISPRPAGFAPALHLDTATGINDVGRIVGYGWRPDGMWRAFLLTPID